jgi:hypothetical protein
MPDRLTDEELLLSGKTARRNLSWDERVRLQRLRAEQKSKKAGPLKVRKLIPCPHCGRLMLGTLESAA